MLGKIEDRRRRLTEDETFGCHHQFNGHELGQILGDGKGQGSLACCSLWSHKESDVTWQLKNNNSFIQVVEFSFLFCEKCLGILKVTAMNK